MSDITINIKILELLASKICHDLISPIGAVNNGVEFVQEMGAEDAGDAIDLIAYSANQASSKLQAYRMAYGAGGADNSIKPEDVHDLIERIITADDKIQQDWDKDAPMGLNPDTFERPEGFAKMLVSAFLLAMDSLPKGGVMKAFEGEDGVIHVTAEGENACIRERSAEALDLTMSETDLEPKYVHAFITGILSKRYGASVNMHEPDNNKVQIDIRF